MQHQQHEWLLNSMTKAPEIGRASDIAVQNGSLAPAKTAPPGPSRTLRAQTWQICHKRQQKCHDSQGTQNELLYERCHASNLALGDPEIGAARRLWSVWGPVPILAPLPRVTPQQNWFRKGAKLAAPAVI
jgi:hypothetical protein